LSTLFNRMTTIELCIAVDFVEKINLNETLVSKLCLVVVNTQLSELLRISKTIFALSGIFHKFIRQNLHDFSSPIRSICKYFPLVKILLRMKLHSKKRIVFSSETR
jgi:hypothetical protein